MGAGQTRGMGQQFGDAQTAGGQILEVTAWDFEPAEKLGGVVTNATGGFEGQIYGSVSGKGKVTVLIPKTASAVPGGFVFGADTVLNLYADAAKVHGYTNIYAALESAPVSIDLSSDKGIEITFNFKSNGPYDAIGAFNILGSYSGRWAVRGETNLRFEIAFHCPPPTDPEYRVPRPPTFYCLLPTAYCPLSPLVIGH